MAKHIFVTGGVVSSLGKGITAASVGMLLGCRGLKVALQKFDPYLNVDPGTMNPYQHGELYVTDDGAETDLDLGHYERFTGIETHRACNYTSGQIYSAVIAKERRGDYLGGTVQVVPHITDEIKAAVRSVADDAGDSKRGRSRLVPPDVVITEVGGTVGDIEGLPFLEAIRQFGLDEGQANVMYIHVTLIVSVKAAGEIKTKPTQHSVMKLREIGITPDVLVCRCERPLEEAIKKKISLFTSVERRCVIEEPDVAETIYEVPFQFIDQGLDELIVQRLGLKAGPLNLGPWPEIIETIRHPSGSVRIGVVGKYSELQDAYKSIYEALDHGGIANNCKVQVKRILSEDVETAGPEAELHDVQGILVPGGFGLRGVEGKIAAARYARTSQVPFLGLCLGMQCAAIDFARNVCGLEGADTTENRPGCPHPVICLMEEQKQVTQKGATMRLGGYPCQLAEGSLARAAYGREEIRERHRHRYEFNNDYRQVFTEHGMRITGVCPQGDLVEIIELADHPWFVAVQFHPEFRSTPVRPHPLFAAFIGAALANGRKRGGQQPAKIGRKQ
ncbi:MAG: CTP synthase [Phycisphaerae bacterium SM23_33]|nr:MAG: CTP synthase [Phycisphaerae bacterium SM23_33]